MNRQRGFVMTGVPENILMATRTVFIRHHPTSDDSHSDRRPAATWHAYERTFEMKAQRGFNLIELIVTVSLATLLLVAGVSSFQTVLDNNRLNTVTNEFVTALNLARSEAVKRNNRVVLRKADTSTSSYTTQSSQGYEQGWIIFVDNDNDATLDTGETLLQVFDRPSRLGVTLQGNANLTDYVMFTPEGFAKTTAGAFQAGTLTVCKNSKARQVIISSTGRIRTVDSTSC